MSVPVFHFFHASDQTAYHELLKLRQVIYEGPVQKPSRWSFDYDASPQTKLALVEYKGKNVGFASFMPLETSPDYVEEGLHRINNHHPGKHILLKEMYFLDGLKRKGLGTRLLYHIQKTIIDKGYSHLLCFDTVNSEKFYIKKGFVNATIDNLNVPKIKKCLAPLCGALIMAASYMSKKHSGVKNVTPT